jgi:hypothetical protein
MVASNRSILVCALEVNGSAFPAVPLGQVIQYRIELVARHGHDRSVHRPCR